MAYVTPRDWVIGDPASSFPTFFNQEIRDNLNSLRAMNDVTIRVHRTATQSMANAARTAISWQAASHQTGITWSSGTNPTRLTVPTSGLYLLAANVKFANVVGGKRGVGWRANGGATAWDLQMHPGNGVDTCTGIELIELVANDYIEVWGYQNSGGAINTSGTTEGDCWAALSLFATGGTTAPLWVPPKTWVDGAPDGIISPADFNTHIRDNVSNLRNLQGVGAKCWISEDQSMSQDQRGKITWDQQTRNLGGLWDGGSKFVAPVDGIYLLMAAIEWGDTSAVGVQGIGYRVNDSSTAHDLQFQEGSDNSPVGTVQGAADLVQLAAGDFVEFYAFQDGTESASIHGGSEDRARVSVLLWAATT